MKVDTGHSSGKLRVDLSILPTLVGKVNRTKLRQAAQVAFETAQGQGQGALTVAVTDDAQIQELNRTYRDVDAPTDVLAFGRAGPTDDSLLPPGEATYCGDIVISYPRALEQAASYGHPVEEELSLLVVHGVLHLLGYDHEQASEREEMWRIQDTALAKLGIHWQP